MPFLFSAHLAFRHLELEQRDQIVGDELRRNRPTPQSRKLRFAQRQTPLDADGADGVLRVAGVNREHVLPAGLTDTNVHLIDLDLSEIPCTVAWPHLPSNTHPATEGKA